MTALQERVSRAIRWCLDGIGPHRLVIPPVVAVVTYLATLINVQAYRGAWYPSDWYDLGFTLACLLPAALGHAIASGSGSRSAFWWLLWLPGLALYWMRPWPEVGGWVLLWMRPDYAWDQITLLARASWSGSTPDPRSVATVSGLAMAVVAMFASVVRLWFALMERRRRDPGEAAKKGFVVINQQQGSVVPYLTQLPPRHLHGLRASRDILPLPRRLRGFCQTPPCPVAEMKQAALSAIPRGVTSRP